MIQNLEKCMDELRKAGLELPPPPEPIELPKKPFGVFVEPTVEAKVSYFLLNQRLLSFKRSFFRPILSF